jgi:aldehyde dehydrogenase (NAD+)
MEVHRDELVDLVVAEVGSPLALARSLQVDQPIKNFQWIADAAERGPMGGYVQRLAALAGGAPSESELRREPIGVVAAIVPFNYPINLVSWKVGPALAAGCTVVLLPSPQGALCALALTRLFDEAGFPPGVFNLVLGGVEISRALVAHPDVDLVSFTGSSATGAAVMALAASTTKKVILELGGKSPSVILPSADLARATGQTILRFARNSGQGCGSTTRIFVHADQYDDFVAEAVSFLETSVPVGDPRDEATVVGPLISAAHLERVEGFLRRAVDAGGHFIYGGSRVSSERGAFLTPTLVGGLDNDAELCEEELFAPVGAVMTFRSVDEAIRLANASHFALNAAVWGDHDEAMEVALRIDSGTVAINGGGGARSDVPWGGGKRSGRGAEMGEDGFREFFSVKHVQWPS